MSGDDLVVDERRTQKTFPGDAAHESGTNIYGCLKQVSLHAASFRT